jgi:hypothetical protein
MSHRAGAAFTIDDRTTTPGHDFVLEYELPS